MPAAGIQPSQPAGLTTRPAQFTQIARFFFDAQVSLLIESSEFSVPHQQTHAKGDGSGPVQVRLIMAGAQVVPAEQPLDPGEPGARVTFYVTPLAKGPLGGCRAEVIQNGRKIAEVRTPARAGTQRMTLLLLL